ncbi:MAG: hypothetical protein M0Z99_20440 [Betaproteobacteria bacterium]|nr:hypothetical protein [Betaproteobacteria bacterium]
MRLDIAQLAADSIPPWTVSMHVNVRFVKDVTLAENMDAATQLVRSQVELFVNKAKAEAALAGIEMRCEYLVTC